MTHHHLERKERSEQLVRYDHFIPSSLKSANVCVGQLVVCVDLLHHVDLIYIYFCLYGAGVVACDGGKGEGMCGGLAREHHCGCIAGFNPVGVVHLAAINMHVGAD